MEAQRGATKRRTFVLRGQESPPPGVHGASSTYVSQRHSATASHIQAKGMTGGRLGPAALRRPRWPALLLVLCRVVASGGTAAEADGRTCDSDPAEVLDSPSLGRPLRPSDLRGPSAFGSFVNSTLDLPGGSRQNVSMGRVRQDGVDGGEGEEDMVDFAVLPSVVDRPDVEELLALLRGYEDWDDDPDSVDGSECSRLSNML